MTGNQFFTLLCLILLSLLPVLFSNHTSLFTKTNMAYIALISLSQTLNEIMDHEQYPPHYEKEVVVSLRRNVDTLLTFLEEFSQKCRGVLNPLESQITDAAYEADNIFEYEPEKNYASFLDVLRKIDFILDEVMKIKNNYPVKVSSPDASDSLSASIVTISDINTMVFEDDFLVIKERIYNRSFFFDVIPIVGMGGIGKSTLARRLYEDSIKVAYFDRCIWIVVSQDYSLKKVLFEVLLSIGMVMDPKKEYTDAELKQLIYQDLFGRRYLIVVDDLWSEKAWDDLNLVLPKDTKGSRVLVTTRLLDVAIYVGSSFNPPHEIQLLNEDESWKLFEERVFGEGSCPLELEQVGKKVAKSCQGLPLTVVVVAGLVKGNTTKEYWESISDNISSSEPTIALHCSKVLSLSYAHLPLYLKPCFLYVTAFPEDAAVRTNRLIRLWIAEGFVRPSGQKCLEDVAEGYLNDLVRRSLLMISEKSGYNDRVKSIRIHDVLRDFGAKNAHEQGFYYQDGDLRREHRWVTINSRDSLSRLLEFHEPAARSALIHYSSLEFYWIQNLRSLRVLDAFNMYMKGSVETFVHLRYFSILFADNIILRSISKLRNIQTLIIKGPEFSRSIVPLTVWKKPSLRHLILPPYHMLELPSENAIIEETSLQTIRSVNSLQLTKKVLEMLLYLRKFVVRYEPVRALATVHDYQLTNLVHLRKLEKLKINFWGIKPPGFSELAFPKSLKKLSLVSVKGPWHDMGVVVGYLPNLEVFKLKTFGSNEEGEWQPTEGQFLKLKKLKFEHVHLDNWEAESVHFPSLEILVLESMKGNLDEIPGGIGEIDALKVIKLVNCEASIVDSARQIQSDQLDMGNEDLQLLVIKEANI